MAHMKRFKSIDAIEALQLYGCFRLASRIHELRHNGHPIEREIVEGSNGKRYAKYYITESS